MTARLVLEPLRVDHAAEMVAVLASPALYAVTGGEPPSLAELTVRYARQTAGPSGLSEPAPDEPALDEPALDEAAPDEAAPDQAAPDQAAERWCNWVLREGDALVGYVQATVTLAGPSTAALAWLVRPQEQGRGLAVEAAAAMAAHLRETGVDALTAWIADHHPASQAVARRLGLRPTERLDDDGERCWVGLTAG